MITVNKNVFQERHIHTSSHGLHKFIKKNYSSGSRHRGGGWQLYVERRRRTKESKRRLQLTIVGNLSPLHIRFDMSTFHSSQILHSMNRMFHCGTQKITTTLSHVQRYSVLQCRQTIHVSLVNQGFQIPPQPKVTGSEIMRTGWTRSRECSTNYSVFGEILS